MTQSGQPGGPPPPPPASPPPPSAPPPDWQSTPQQPSSPPPSGGSGTPTWTANLTSQAPVAGPAGYYYADVPNRIIAYIIDAIIVGIGLFIVNAILASFLPAPTVRIDPNNPFNISVDQPIVTALILAVVNIALAGAYFIYTWTAMRGTLGMKVLGMQIGHEQDGRTITFNQGVIRYLLLGAPFSLATALTGYSSLGGLIGLAAFVYFIALLVTTAQSPTKQGLHDRYAKTMVVKAARSVA